MNIGILGITLMPRSVVEKARAHRLKSHTLPKRYAETQTMFIRRRDAFASRALTEFVQCAKGDHAAIA